MGGTGGQIEEVKFVEGDDDQVDLLNDKKGFDELKNALARSNF